MSSACSNTFQSYLSFVIFFLSSYIIPSLSSPPLLSFRPPATPLIVQSPFISIWSVSDTLTETETENWSGTETPISGLLRVDGISYRWLGASSNSPAVLQNGFSVISATRTRVSFSAGGINALVTFTSPLIPSYMMLLSQPATYIDWSITSSDSLNHTVDLYFDADSKIFTNQSSSTTLVTWSRVPVNNLLALRAGAASQYPLDPVVCGQSVPLTGSQTITWGYLYFLTEDRNNVQGFLGPTELSRASFSLNGTLPLDAQPPLAVGDGSPGIAISWSWTMSAGETITRNMTLFYDEILTASYYKDDPAWIGNSAQGVFSPLWRRTLPFNDTVGVPTQALASASSYAFIASAAADSWDTVIFNQLNVSGNAELATFGSLVFRQILGAFSLIWHEERNELWYVFKEISSGGDFSTVDVLYPSSPFFVANCPELLRAALLPIMVLSANATLYKKNYVMHDLGKFPIANRGWGGQEDMPLEETGNLMHMLAAIAMQEGGNVTWLNEFFIADGGMHRWRDFLISQLPIVPRQGTTDDFLGVVSNSTNLGVKGAVGLAAYGILAFMSGNETDANAAWEYAAYSASINIQNGFFVDHVANGGANRSHFCWGWNACNSMGDSVPNSTFLMYNFLYARILRMRNLFPNQQELLNQQANYYEQTIQGPFGISLMNGSTGVMPEWNSFFAASLYPIPNSTNPIPSPPVQATRIFTSFLRAANQTSFRAPMTDYWDSKTASYGGKYRARPVVGGIFSPVAVTLFEQLPVFPHEPLMAAAFERGHEKARTK
jgi:hypothetical protein